MVLLFQGKTVQTSEIPEACPRWEAEFERRPPWHSSFTWISDKVTYRVQLLVLLKSQFKESSEDANLPFRGNGLLWDMIRRIPNVSKPLDPIKAGWHKSVNKTGFITVLFPFFFFLWNKILVNALLQVLMSWRFSKSCFKSHHTMRIPFTIMKQD